MAGLTYEEIRRDYPKEWAARIKNKLYYRWPGPGGEGYVDVIDRLRAVIIELERVEHHVLLLTHRAVLRVLLAYFFCLDSNHLFDLQIPAGSLFCIEVVSPICDHNGYDPSELTAVGSLRSSL